MAFLEGALSGAYRVSWEGGDEITERETSGDELIGDEGRSPTEPEIDGDREDAASDWDETNDEPAAGEGGQESV